MLNPDFEHSFQKMLRGITPVSFDENLHFDVPASIPDGSYIATYDTEDHGFYHISVYSIPAWNSLQTKIAKRWADDEDRRFKEFRRTTSNQESLEIENRRAIGMQQRHLDYAHIESNAVIVGQDDCFLIMNNENLKRSMQDDFEHDFSVVWPL